jgi:hypothetical protein
MEYIQRALQEALGSVPDLSYIDATGELHRPSNSDPQQPFWGHRVSRLFYEQRTSTRAGSRLTGAAEAVPEPTATNRQTDECRFAAIHKAPPSTHDCSRATALVTADRI